ncbi:hypothetical protein WICPIJ_006104 [Wickerhamomyces pijperi]|uniref:Carboxypeptidase n=1 Tax=Wickerhamomyces pijperi TaxID=599730 RepID=A0A9P8Q4F8_WICPI|nr:hypothetical protein WICPIJ_006104 [Wickerhamomyces pijperi]
MKLNIFTSLLILGKVWALPTSSLDEPATSLEAKNFIVTTLPGLDAIPTDLVPEMYAGLLPITNSTETTDTSSELFFWKFVKPSRDSSSLVIWLNGGPGCSSMDGALMESGPFRITNDLKLAYNKGSFHEAADIIYVDQPRGTGFSYTDGEYDVDLDELALHFVQFLKNYYAVFPDDLEKDVYIAGESYAGQYIPFIAKAILDDAELSSTGVRLNGLVIGNGWIDPVAQSLSYIPYLLESKVISSSDEFFSSLLSDQERCQNAINEGAGKDSFTITICEQILNKILLYTKDTTLPEDQQCLNMYDTQLRDSYPSCGMNWPPDLKNVNPYLAQEEFVKAVNLNPSRVQKWRECDNQVSKFLKNKHSKPSINLLPDLLETLEIVLFGGDRDIICNNRGVKDSIKNMEWLGLTGFSDSLQQYEWRYDNGQVGYVQTERNLTFVEVYNSSHMVPFDKPLEARGVFDIMIKNFELKTSDDGKEFVETPVYAAASPDEDSATTPPPSSPPHKSSLPFLFYLLAVISFGALAYYYNKDRATIGRKPILRNGNQSQRQNKKKKRVSWADFVDEFDINDEQQQQQSHGSVDDGSGDMTPDLELGEVRKSGKVGQFFNTNNSSSSSSSKSQGKYSAVNGDAYEDIELDDGGNYYQEGHDDENDDDDEFDLSLGSSNADPDDVPVGGSKK